jgi:aromatic ring-cleaving dioxygenase
MPGVTNRLRIEVIDFDLLDRHRLAQRLDVQQVAQMDRRVRPHRRAEYCFHRS